MSFHASSRLIQVNLLHAEVSYIIDIACHWSFFFSNITSFSYFLDRQNPDFFPFSNSQFLPNRTRLTYVHQCCGLISGLKHAIGPYCGIVWVLFTISSDFLCKSALNPKIWAENRENFNKIGDVSDPGTETNASQVRMWFEYEYLMSSKTGNSAKDFRR